MFSKAKKKGHGGKNTSALQDLNAPDSPSPHSSQAKTTAKMAPPKKSSARSGPTVPSLISADVLIKGSVSAEGEVQFDGSLEGDIRAKSLMIGESATVKGEVIAEKVRVAGTVEGAIRAHQVELTTTAIVKGDVHHTALSIEAGAKLDGNCRHSDKPMDEDKSKSSRVAPRSSLDDAQDQSESDNSQFEESSDKEEQHTSFLAHKGKVDLR